MAKRIRDLTIEATNEFDYVVEIDRAGEVETKQMTMKVLHEPVTNTIDATGLSSQTVNFSSYNTIVVTIDQDCTLNISNVLVTDVTLIVLKGSANIATISGLDHVTESRQDGETTLFYKIYAQGSYQYGTRINDQYSDTLVIGDLSPGIGTINSLDHFKWKIEGTKCNVNTEFTFSHAIPIVDKNQLTVTLSNFAPTLLYSNNALAAYIEIGTDNYAAQCNINDSDELEISWDFGLGSGVTATIYINGDFEIK